MQVNFYTMEGTDVKKLVVLPNKTIKLKVYPTFISPEIQQAQTLVFGINLIGTKNGTNKVFTIPLTTLIDDTEVIAYNGIVLVRNTGYTINEKTITLTSEQPAPESTDTLVLVVAQGVV